MPFIQRRPSHDIPYIDIRLDDDVVVFRGGPDESGGASLKGHLALCVRETVAIKNVTLVLTGVKRLSWTERTAIMPRSRAIRHEEILFEKKWSFIDSGQNMFTLKPNNYEYPFQLTLNGDLPESVEGLGASHIVYRLKARVTRGKFSHDITAKKHLRIIRTLGPGSLELIQSMSMENIWPNKIEYAITIPTKAIVFGTFIPISLVMIPILKGLTIGSVTCVLKETQHMSCRDRGSEYNDTRVVLTQTFTSAVLEEDEAEDMGRWILNDRVILPKSLDACVQDCEVPSIRVKHKLQFIIQLHNPAGHLSELRATLPVMLFISPNYLMDESNRIPADTVVVDTAELINAPPRYDEHYLDRLYENISGRNFETPLPSGANTPMVLSRNNSRENISTAAMDPTRLPEDASCRWETPAEITQAGPSEVALPNGRGSRAPSLSSPLALPRLEDLSRVPSYCTAVRMGTRNLNDANALPRYDTGIRSAPVSPRLRPVGGHGNLRPRLRSNTGSSTGVGQRTQSAQHMPSLVDLLEILRS